MDIKTVKQLAQGIVDVHLYPAHNYEFGCRFCGACADNDNVPHKATCLVLVAKNILKEPINANLPT